MLGARRSRSGDCRGCVGGCGVLLGLNRGQRVARSLAAVPSRALLAARPNFPIPADGAAEVVVVQEEVNEFGELPGFRRMAPLNWF